MHPSASAIVNKPCKQARSDPLVRILPAAPAGSSVISLRLDYRHLAVPSEHGRRALPFLGAARMLGTGSHSPFTLLPKMLAKAPTRAWLIGSFRGNSLVRVACPRFSAEIEKEKSRGKIETQLRAGVAHE